MVTDLMHTMLHLDVFLAQWTVAYGAWVYLILFAIVYAETGLVVCPFLPGDSLLFAVGALCAIEGSALNYLNVWIVLFIAAFLGDNTNYQVGLRIGERIAHVNNSFFFNRKNLHKAQEFYKKYGSFAVVFARFMPIVRTFAPFTAGLAKMPYLRFITFSLVASVTWISLFLTTGFYFGNLPVVKKNFHLVIFAVIILSLLPIVIGVIKNSWAERKAKV